MTKDHLNGVYEFDNSLNHTDKSIKSRADIGGVNVFQNLRFFIVDCFIVITRKKRERFIALLPPIRCQFCSVARTFTVQQSLYL